MVQLRLVTPRRTALLAALSLGAGMLVASPAAPADRGRAPVFAPHALPFGQTYGEWAADWWTWALTQPVGVNPLLDLTGAHCAQGQRGRVWFLAGTFGDPSSVSRTCTVPKGKALLFPVLNNFSGATEQDPPSEKTEAFQRSRATPAMEAATNLHASIDGVPVPDIKARYFEKSPVFKVMLPANNIFGLDHDCLPSDTPDAGCEVFPTVDAGYYLVVKPLKKGQHTINFGGSGPGFTVDASYSITVSKRKRDN
jgi:hypothetical protein